MRRIADDKPEVLVHAGDWASTKQSEFKLSMRMFREAFPDIPILCVRGNHDFWGMENIEKDLVRHEEWFKDFNIHHLSKPITINSHKFIGFDGWYHHHDPPTNDLHWMPCDYGERRTHAGLAIKAHCDFSEVMIHDEKPLPDFAICVTHFPPSPNMYSANPGFLEPLCERFDALLLGHSHEKQNCVLRECLILNCGSDYDSPRHVLFELQLKPESDHHENCN